MKIKLLIYFPLVFLFSFCAKKPPINQNQPSTSTNVDTSIVDSSYSDTSDEMDTLAIFVKTEQKQKRIKNWFGKSTIYTGKESYLLYNGLYALAVWKPQNGENVTAVYKLPVKNYPDTICILNSDTSIVRITDGDDWPQGIDGHYLLLDYGCCPGPRGIKIIDINSRDTILNGSYTEFVGYDSSQTLIYYAPFRKATKEDCSEYDRYIKEYLDPFIEQVYSFNVNTREKKGLGKFRCVAYN